MSMLELRDFPCDAFRALLAIDPQQRELVRLYMECSDEIQSVVRCMFAVLEHEHTTKEDRERALSTIADALFLNPEKDHGNYGMDLTRVERDSARGHLIEARRPVVANRLTQLDTQEA